MASAKGSKSGALDAFWDTVSGTSNTSGSMADLFKSLPGSPAANKARPPDAETKSQDNVLILVKALVQAATKGWTVAEIVQNTGLNPSLCLTAIHDAKQFGLIAENDEEPEKKRFRLTTAGNEFAKA
jgi:predicted transcriptional regulator